MNAVSKTPPTALGWPQRLLAITASRRFFLVTVGLLVLEAAWLALSGRYPMAFDEDFHLGVIRLYAHHLSPFWGNQPESADVYGAVARDPSYLYHYLLSFPYRLISVFTNDQTIQVLWLRALNIGLFSSGLVLFRRLLLQTGASRAIVHGCMLAFVLIPIMPLLAAQINYDNLLFPLTAVSLLLAARLTASLRRGKPLDAVALLWLLSTCLLASLVKYAFLPIFLAIVAYLMIQAWRTYRSWHRFWASWRQGFGDLSTARRWLLLAGLLLCFGLFAQRDAVNVVRYHTPVPDCGQVLDVESCSDYGPWIRDYNLHIAKFDAPRSPAVFTADWFYGMWLRLFFAVDGPASQFETRGPLLLPALIGMLIPVLALLALVTRGRQLFRIYNGRLLSLLLTVSGVYIATLWLDEYRAFLRTGQPVAINGRYLLPVLLPLLVISALAITQWLRKPIWRLTLASLAIACLLVGGGSLTYILRSSDSWYWPNQTVRTVNHAVQRTLGPVVPGYRTPTLFLR